ncbi:hypothetical protein [Xanthomarina spongicola]|uniref:Uncharacterized protein n=1 Tax=Xanthomarina spongicola TaxID=570520 RepID=A0A316DQE1_9FLAO|nr:hypothetical protein [Xanthomarina spongicola]PWK20447.1 hypothetical protein LX78_00147 [Xanthomarina spongicola]
MSKKVVSIFLSVVFILFIVTPTVIMIVDDTIDISIVYSTSEEEERGHEKQIDKEILFSNLKSNESDFVFNSTENSVGYCNKKYAKPHLNLISPPPQLNI